MGLDMYLKRLPKVETNEQVDELISFESGDVDRLVEHGKRLNENFDVERHLTLPEDWFPYGWAGKEVGYWRKANHIHRWFVENVQGGMDECVPHIVTKEKIEELLDAAKSATNPRTAGEVLPTQSGFFFGGTDYDDYYFEDNKNTVKILEEVLADTDFEKESIFYVSSW